MSNERISELERRLESCTRELEAAHRELDSLSFAISHDLRAPLRVVDARLNMLVEDFGPQLDAKVRACADSALDNTRRLGAMIEDLLKLSRLGRTNPRCQTLDLSARMTEIATCLQARHPDRSVQVRIAPGLTAQADPALIGRLAEELLSNAWKYTARRADAVVEFGAQVVEGERVFYVRDNGAGFNMKYAGKLFKPFQRMHTQDDFPGAGLGLATALRIVSRHGGKLWTEAEVDRGATFYFTLGRPV